eukprot:1008658-Prymnesium_polylepis.1
MVTSGLVALLLPDTVSVSPSVHRCKGSTKAGGGSAGCSTCACIRGSCGSQWGPLSGRIYRMPGGVTLRARARIRFAGV